jgi:hypothetical protein
VIDTSVGVGVISDSFPRIVIDTSVGLGVMSDSFPSLYGIKILKHKTNSYTPPLTWMTTSRENNNNALIRYVKSLRVSPDDGLLFPEGITWWWTIIPRGYHLMMDYYSPRVSPDDGLLFPEGITWWRTNSSFGYHLTTAYYSPRVAPDDGLLFPEGITWW